MQDYPHRYRVAASAQHDSNVELASPGIASLESAAPAEFGGPGDRWSPETLLVAAVADCFVLSFKAVARASRMEWTSLSCSVEGTLDKVDGVTRFTEFQVHASLVVPEGVDVERARRRLEKAERVCLITNSLIAESELTIDVAIAA